MNEISLADNAALLVQEGFLDPTTSATLMAHIATLPLEESPAFMIYGKPARMHRDIGFFTDEPGVAGGDSCPLDPSPVMARYHGPFL